VKQNCQQIEALRLVMNKGAINKELTDPRVLSLSRQLDLLINEFYSAQKVSQLVAL